MKRFLDIVISILVLIFFGVFILILVILQSYETREFGIFKQLRVGIKGKLFYVYKIRTMKNIKYINTTITTVKDIRITRIGKILRKYKFDELPQFYNVLIGDMSIVGPRPDVPEFINQLPKNEQKIILSLKPGITGPSSLDLIDEEEVLSKVKDPQKYNLEVIWPRKLKLIREYINDYSIWLDIYIILKTIVFILKKI